MEVIMYLFFGIAAFSFYKCLTVGKKKFEKPKEEYDKVLKCPDCEGTKWYEGPSGGASMNIECASCHHQFNYTGGIVPLEFIGKNEARIAAKKKKKLEDFYDRK